MKSLAILDLETDPFKYGRVPKPFVAGVYMPESWRYFWGPNCIEDSVAYISGWSGKWIVGWHNGGKFDGMYYLKHMTGNLKVINGRIVQCNIAGQDFRDTFAILPFPLADYKKDPIDYAKMEAEVRELHKKEILDYLKGDCKYLYDLTARFYKEFGQKFLTVGSAAMHQIKQRHEVTRTKVSFDRTFRKSFFYGGRVQCFQTGIIPGDVSIYDVNSMYPAMMRNQSHPVDSEYVVGDTVTDDTIFIVADGINRGAFPARTKSGLQFDQPEGTFSVTRAEFDAGHATRTFVLRRIVRTFDFARQASMSDFVDYAFNARALAKASGDEAGDIAWKYVSNSGYGKYCQNPANFADWKLAPLNDPPPGYCRHCEGFIINGVARCLNLYNDGSCWECESLNDYLPLESDTCLYCGGSGWRWNPEEFNSNDPNGPQLWKARTLQNDYYNVATGASITGHARATLLRGIALADDPLYCDTDSIITRGSFRGPVSAKLGEWKHEGTGVLSAIAGKKLYCIFSDRAPEFSDPEKEKIARRKYPWMFVPVYHNRRKLWAIKKAHKGMKLSPSEILHVAMGNEIEVPNIAPSFSLTREPMFISRRARRTA